LGGLSFFQAKTNTYRDFNEEEGLFDLKIYCLADDKFANIWMGTANGIYKYILNRDTIIRMSELELNSKIINSLLFLNDSTLIVGSNLGFNKVIFDTNIEKLIRKESYDKQNGFKFSETNQNALCKDKNGHVWFGTMGGLTCFSPELEDTIKIIPAVYITNIRLSFGNVDWSSLGVKTSDFMNLPENLSLAYTKNHVTFDFNGLYLRNPEKVLFRYKLEPYETEWSPVTQNTSVTYPGLSDNVYTFSLVASVDGVHWSAPLNYAFRITPPFWKTLWFYALCTLALITFLVFYIQRREKKLREEKEHLEQVVKERTAEVVAQKDEIEKQKEEITDSITYARRIQRAVLPGIETLEKNTADCFILFKPRDIVSGDFYWIERIENQLIVAAADCTGHGVPGAFMSMLGVSFMNKIIKEQKNESPDSVLAQMRHNVITSLKQGNHEGSSKDGMDMALCMVNLETLLMIFAGAYNPALVISNGEAEELKADRMPVGYHIVMHDYTPVSRQLKKGDCVYLFSDGFQDQIGGPTARKFMRKNMRELLIEIHKKTFCEQKEILDTTIENWRNHPLGKTDQMDDILVMGFQV
jgi:serine phosphatase RsbU (regulator of sigma subunit)